MIDRHWPILLKNSLFASHHGVLEKLTSQFGPDQTSRPG